MIKHSYFASLHSNLFAGFVVSLIALPLALGLAVASGFPMVAGIVTAVVGGVVVSVFGGSYVTITGPGYGLVVVLLSAVVILGEGDMQVGYLYALSAVIISGGLLLLFGFLRFGTLSDFFPASTIQGMLSAIGVTLLLKQFYVMFGDMKTKGAVVELLAGIPDLLKSLSLASEGRLYAVGIGVISLCIMFFYSKITNRFFRLLPAPMWVVVLALGFDAYFTVVGGENPISKNLLISLPKDMLTSMPTPDFSKWKEPFFWGIVLSVTLVSSIESLLSIKAVDKLDPEKRRSNINKDMRALCIATIVSGFLGGMNVGTVISRSSVNVNNQATNRSSNFFHAVFLLLFVILFQNQLGKIPFTSLAAILVYTGYKLAAPTVFVRMYQIGKEQLFVFLTTLVSTLITDLITGILIGVLATFVVHVLLNKAFWLFSRNLLKPNVLMYKENETQNYYVGVIHFCTFLNFYKLKSKLDKIPQNERAIVDFSLCSFVDHTVQESLQSYEELFDRKGGALEIVGLDIHATDSSHPFAVRTLRPMRKLRVFGGGRTKRQLQLEALAQEKGWSYREATKSQKQMLRDHPVYQTASVERVYNLIEGPKQRLSLCDIHYSEGAFIAKENVQTTLLRVRLDKKIPVFSFDRELLLEKLSLLAGIHDIDFPEHPEFSRDFYVQGNEPKKIQSFFNNKMVSFFSAYGFYHIMSNGKELLVRQFLRPATPAEAAAMIEFGLALKEKIDG
ncbi:MAG: sulfate transporter [Flavobacteriaceae bacterium]|nr:sulfate transporter [Flavobacteriaceae bacterium]